MSCFRNFPMNSLSRSADGTIQTERNHLRLQCINGQPIYGNSDSAPIRHLTTFLAAEKSQIGHRCIIMVSRFPAAVRENRGEIHGRVCNHHHL